jgi:phosphoserine phosphatase
MVKQEFSNTGLVLVSTADKQGVQEEVLAVLAPFTITIIEIQRIQLRGRLILGILIGLDLAHASAIAADIDAFSQESGIDAAFDYDPDYLQSENG